MLLFGALLIMLSLHFATIEMYHAERSAAVHLKYISYTNFDWCVWVFVCALVYLIFQKKKKIISVFILLYSILLHIWICGDKLRRGVYLTWDVRQSALAYEESQIMIVRMLLPYNYHSHTVITRPEERPKSLKNINCEKEMKRKKFASVKMVQIYLLSQVFVL